MWMFWARAMLVELTSISIAFRSYADQVIKQIYGKGNRPISQ